MHRSRGVPPVSWTLDRWVVWPGSARLIDIDEGRAEGPSSDEREELRRLRRENRTVIEEREIVKKRRSSSPRKAGDPVTTFRFIAAKKTEHCVKTMCRVLGVSRSGYHAWATQAVRAGT